MIKKILLFLLAFTLFASVNARPADTQRVVAIADIHGDLDAFVGILQRTGLVDKNTRWIARNTTLVQTGDFLDRGPKARAVMDLLMTLQKDAPRQAGRVIVLMGNHEAMNIYGDLRYVVSEDYASFADTKSESRRKSAYASYAELNKSESETEWMKSHPPGFIEHREAFGPDGKYGRWLRSLPPVARVNDSIFLHGGIHPQFATWKLEKINDLVAAEIKAFDAYKKYMVEQKIALPFYTLDELMMAASAAVEKKVDVLKDFLGLGGWLSIHPDGPLLFRGYAQWSDAEGAPQIQTLATAFGVARFVVGHTPQAGQITERFGGKVYLIDTGMLSSYFNGGRASALNIQDGKVSAIYMQDSKNFN